MRQLLCFSAILVLIPSSNIQAEQSEIQRLIRLLGSDDFEKREQAEQQILKLGMSAMPELKKGSGAKDLQVRRKVKELLIRIPKLHLARLSEKGRAATALIQIPYQFGFRGDRGEPSFTFVSAVCVHPSGVFVTGTSLPRRTTADSCQVILSPGTATQRPVMGHLLATDSSLGLGLFQIDIQGPHPAIELGDDKKMTELMEVILLSTSVPTKNGATIQAQPIHAERGYITSIQKVKGVLSSASVDFAGSASNNPIQGPVLDIQGKLLGIRGAVSSRGFSRRSTASTNEMVPVSRLRMMLSQPQIHLALPTISLENRHQQTRFAVRFLDFAQKRKVKIELTLRVEGRKPRTLTLKEKDGEFEVKTAPIPKPDADAPLMVTVQFAKSRVTAKIPDREIRILDRTLQLSQVKSISWDRGLAQGLATVTLAKNASSVGKLQGLEKLTARIGGVERAISLDKAQTMSVEPPSSPYALICEVRAIYKGKTIAQIVKPLSVTNPPTRVSLP